MAQVFCIQILSNFFFAATEIVLFMNKAQVYKISLEQREDMLWDRAFPGAEHAITMA
jgi:hypothetical protein